MERKRVIILGKNYCSGKSETWNCMDVETYKVDTYKFMSVTNNFIIYIFCKWDYMTHMQNVIKNYNAGKNASSIVVNLSVSTVNVKTNANFLTLFGVPHLDKLNSKMCVIEVSLSNYKIADKLWSHLETIKKLQPFFYTLKPFNILMRDILRNIIYIENRIELQPQQQQEMQQLQTQKKSASSTTQQAPKQKLPHRQVPSVPLSSLPNISIMSSPITMRPLPPIPQSAASGSTSITCAAAASSSSSQAFVRDVLDLDPYLPMNIYTVVVNKNKEITGYSPTGTDNAVSLDLTTRALSQVPMVFVEIIHSHGLNFPKNSSIIDCEIEQIIITIHMSFHIILSKGNTRHGDIELLLNCTPVASRHSSGNFNLNRIVKVINFSSEVELLKYFIHLYCHGELFRVTNNGQNIHYLVTENYAEFSTFLMSRLIKNNIWSRASIFCVRSGNFALFNRGALILTPSIIDLGNLTLAFNYLHTIYNMNIIKPYLREDFDTTHRANNIFQTFSLNVHDFKSPANYEFYRNSKFCYYEYFIKYIIHTHEITLNNIIFGDHMHNLLKKLNSFKLFIGDINLISENTYAELGIFYSYLRNCEILLNGHITNSIGVFIEPYSSVVGYYDHLKLPNCTDQSIIVNQEVNARVNMAVNLQATHGRLVPVAESILGLTKRLNKFDYKSTKNFNPHSNNSIKIKLQIDFLYEAILNKYKITLNNQCIVLGIELMYILSQIRKTKCSANCFIFHIETMRCIEDHTRRTTIENIDTNQLYIIIVPYLDNINYFQHKNNNDSHFRSIVEYFSNDKTVYSNMSFAHVVRLLYNKHISFIHNHIIEFINADSSELRALRNNFEYDFILEVNPDYKNNVLEVFNGSFLIELPDKYLTTFNNDIDITLRDNLILFFNDSSSNIDVKLAFKSKFILKYTKHINDYIYYNNSNGLFLTSHGMVMQNNLDYLTKLFRNVDKPTLQDFNDNYFSTVLWYLHRTGGYRRKIKPSDRQYILNTKFISPSRQININVVDVFFSVFFVYERQLLDSTINDVTLDDAPCLSLFYKELGNKK